MFVLTFFICVDNLVSQPTTTIATEGIYNDIATSSALGKSKLGMSKQVSYDDIDGSPYFHDDYVFSSATKTDGSILDSIKLKYDLYSFSFLAKQDDGKEITVNDRLFREFKLNIEGEEILFKRIDPKNPFRFYEVIYTDEGLTIYKSEEIQIEKGKDQVTSKSNDRFFSRKRYLIKKGKQIQIVKLKKKVLWKYFDQTQREILDNYLEIHKMKLRKVKDYRKLFKILEDTHR